MLRNGVQRGKKLSTKHLVWLFRQLTPFKIPLLEPVYKSDNSICEKNEQLTAKNGM